MRLPPATVLIYHVYHGCRGLFIVLLAGLAGFLPGQWVFTIFFARDGRF